MIIKNLIDDFKKGSKSACARIITLLDNDDDSSMEIMRSIYSPDLTSFRIGITGPPGVGKSTIVNNLITYYAQNYKRVGIIAIDPSSPFTGGAILGDRLRMQNNYDYENVFVRSVASRGSLGGLSSSTENIALVMESFGMDVILIETVGVGQSELDIMEVADTVVVTLVPESGDSIQAMKAGIMEIADIFVINKSDREGADRSVEYVRSILSMKSDDEEWMIPVIKISAKNNENISELVQAIESHKKHLIDTGKIISNRKIRKIKEVKELLRDYFIKSIDKFIKNIENVEQSPYEIANDILKKTGLKDLEDLWKKR